MQITTVLPVSRLDYLDRVLDSLKNQTRKPSSLLVIYDGPDEHFLEVRNKVVGQPYSQVLCVSSGNTTPVYTIPERREHIANIHNQARQMIGEADWVFSIEDDGILPSDALELLILETRVRAMLNVYGEDKSQTLGIATGVELGRWGVPYVGAWRTDDIYNPTKLTSMKNKTGQFLSEEIDGCGLYCALIRGDIYRSHEFSATNGLGPDVNLGLYARQLGYQNRICWTVPVTHLTSRIGLEIEIPATDQSQMVTLTLVGKTWKQTKYPYGQVPI